MKTLTAKIYTLLCSQQHYPQQPRYGNNPLSINREMDKEDVVQIYSGLFSSVQSLSCVQLFGTPWTAARQASLSITNSQSLLKLMSIESVMHPTISSSVIPLSSRLQSFLASGSFQMSHFFVSGGQSIGGKSGDKTKASRIKQGYQ